MKNLILMLMVIFLIACSRSSEPLDKVAATDQPAIENEHSNGLDKTTMTFSISQAGGCMMAGPNCAEYQLNVSTGDFKLLRVQENSVIEGNGKVDQELVNKWFAELDRMNVTEFIDSLGEGECRACYDGIDIDYNVVSDGFSVFSLSSREKGFDSSINFFELSEIIYKEMAKQAQLEMKMRKH